MQSPRTQIEVFKHLAPLVPAMDKFKETKDGALGADKIQLIKDVYPDIQVFCSGCLPRVFNTNCGSCVREIFEVVISFYDRLKRNPHINPEADQEPTAPIVPIDTRTPEQILEDNTKEAERLSSGLMSEQEEDALLAKLGITRDSTPTEYLNVIVNFIISGDGLTSFTELEQIKLSKKLEDLLSSEDIEVNSKIAAIVKMSVVLQDGDPKKDEMMLVVDALRLGLKPEHNSDTIVNNETKDEVIDQERDGKPLANETNMPLNTADTRTKWQKTADTKRANALKKAELEAKNPGK